MPNRRIRVFVVDDDPVVASTLATILRVSGYTAQHFTDPLELLRVAESTPPDLLLSDVFMPQLSGIDLALDLKAMCPSCKVLLFSGQAASIDFAKDATRIEHHFHVLPKPILPGDILAAIRDQLLEN